MLGGNNAKSYTNTSGQGIISQYLPISIMELPVCTVGELVEKSVSKTLCDTIQYNLTVKTLNFALHNFNFILFPNVSVILEKYSKYCLLNNFRNY